MGYDSQCRRSKSDFEYIFIRIDAKEAVDGRESKQGDGYWNGKTKFPSSS
ncbi:hypothetical protein CCACVL1_29447 [Corchorus capsularis]|uniref:Uncharacterized protein n=1 Tax=Corchorus capsularis TaxID=210143 RepID=A0A1R3G1M9_COCAP|nr:hypothetical protein CCACVL1_29447 [Corchorus capsularis]